jgi:hypothetical protein
MENSVKYNILEQKLITMNYDKKIFQYTKPQSLFIVILACIFLILVFATVSIKPEFNDRNNSCEG